jgi:hypothetical protein
MARTLEVTEKEREFLTDLLDWWEEGFEEAKKLTTEDRSLELDDLMKLASSLDDQKAMIKDLKYKLTKDLAVSGTSE